MNTIIRGYHVVNNFFSSKYANTSAIEGNFVSLILYKLAYPSAKIFARLSIKPNIITWLSSFFTIMAVVYLTKENGGLYFVLFWLLSLHLDFCDGTLARMTKSVSKSAFRIDHMTDLIKVCMVFLGIGLHYDAFSSWILVCVSIFSFMYSDILNYEMKYYLKLSTNNNMQLTNNKINESSWIKKTGLTQFGLLTSFLRNIHSIFFGISGHTLLFFCIIPLGVNYSNAFLIYFSCLSIYSAIRTIISLSSLKR